MQPTAAMRVIGCVDHGPTGLCGLQAGMGRGDPLGNARYEVIDVCPVLPRSQAIVHGTGRRMGVRGRDQKTIGGNPALLAGAGLDRIANIARQHARIHDDDRQRLLPIGKHQAAGVERIVDPVARGFQKAPVSNRRQRAGRDIDRLAARPQRALLGR